jgi:hypothetical protein
MKASFEPAPVTDPTLTPRVPRPQDIAYEEPWGDKKCKKRLCKQCKQCKPHRHKQKQLLMTCSKSSAIWPQSSLKIGPHLTSQKLQSSGRTEDWDTWYQKFRTYLKAKGWLDTFSHPTGPGTPGINQGINEKIYNKLTILCGMGNALTYVQSAAEFVGHGAGQKLLGIQHQGIQHQGS